jgi:hypothetical protein
MKRIFVALLVGVITLPAVQWEAEQVVDESGLPAKLSILTLDKLGTPHILYYANDAEEEVNILKYAQHVGENWQIRDVDSMTQYKSLTFSFDFNPQNDAVIAYTDSVPVGNLDIFLALEGELAFEYVNLNDDAFLQLDPVVHVGSDGIVRLVYREQNDEGFNIRYGWYDGEDFFSESVKDSMGSHLLGFDFCLDGDDEPHVFYSGDDGDLWYAYRIGEADWSNTSLEIRGDQPTVAMDTAGYFHIGCETPPHIYYVTNASGTWQEEMVEENTTGDQNWVHPSLALDTEGTPHITWFSWTAPYHVWTNEVWYSSRAGGSWSARDSLPPNEAKEFGYVNPFHIDSGNYGHICYTVYEDLYYVRSAEPLISGIAENLPQITSQELTVAGSVIFFSLPHGGPVRLDLYDVTGRRVDHLTSGNYPAGQNSITINSTELPAGVYFVCAEIGGNSASARFVLTH